MKTLTKFFAIAATAATLTAFAAPANAVIYIGLQTANVNGGAISNVASGPGFASYSQAYGNFELTFTSGALGLDPVLLGSTSHIQNSRGSGGTLDVYVTRTGITGPTPLEFISSFTSNVLTAGWSLTESTYYSASNAIFAGTALSSFTFTPPGLGTFEHTEGAPAAGSPYSITQVYHLVAPTRGESLATISIAAGAVPESATWGLMIMGFGGIGAMIRRRRQGAAFA